MLSNTLYEKNVQVSRTLGMGAKFAAALGDDTRLKILEIIIHKAMTADEITRQLHKMGVKKALTTVRHHLELLRSAGLIEVSRIDEVRGTVSKSYSPTVRTYNWLPRIPGDPAACALIEELSNGLSQALSTLINDERFLSLRNKKTVCKVCRRDHQLQSLALNLIEVALAKTIQSDRLDWSKQPKNGGND